MAKYLPIVLKDKKHSVYLLLCLLYQRFQRFAELLQAIFESMILVRLPRFKTLKRYINQFFEFDFDFQKV